MSATTGVSDGVGTIGITYGTPEFRATFVVAEQVKGQLEVLDPTITAIITKASANASIDNVTRARQLGDNNADIFISIHFDGFPRTGGAGARRTSAIVLPEMFEEMIGGVNFRTWNQNKQDEIDFAQDLIDSIVNNFFITSGDAPADGGITSTGTIANKGVLFETKPDGTWSTNAPWEERLYHTTPSTPASSRGLAVLFEVDNFKNPSVVDWLNNPDGSPFEPRYRTSISNHIAQAIVNKLNE